VYLLDRILVIVHFLNRGILQDTLLDFFHLLRGYIVGFQCQIKRVLQRIVPYEGDKVLPNLLTEGLGSLLLGDKLYLLGVRG